MIAHARQIDQRLHRRVHDVTLGGLGDIDGEVADAFEVDGNLRGGDDEAEIAGHGLLQGQQLETAIVDLDLQRVQLAVARHDLLDLFEIRGNERGERGAHALFGAGAHEQQAPLELIEIVREMADVAHARERSNRG